MGEETLMAEGHIGDIVAALLQVMQTCGYVQNTGKNAFHGYTYATEADVLEKVRPAMIENGLILIPSLDGDTRVDEHGNTHLVVAYTLAHVSGAIWPEKIRIPGCGGDKSKAGVVGDKGTYKAMTGANKYLLTKLFQIATGDDPEVDSPETKPDARKNRPANDPPTSGQLSKAEGIIKEKNLSAQEVREWLTQYGEGAEKVSSLSKALISRFIDNFKSVERRKKTP